MAAAAAPLILELDPSHDRAGRVIEDIVRLERRIFPKHESLARSLHDELKRRNSGLIYTTSGADGEEVIGYAMYTCNTSLCATITKLAVKENCRRQGHGEALLAAAVERCRRRKIQRLSLHVDPTRRGRPRWRCTGRPGSRSTLPSRPTTHRTGTPTGCTWICRMVEDESLIGQYSNGVEPLFSKLINSLES